MPSEVRTFDDAPDDSGEDPKPMSPQASTPAASAATDVEGDEAPEGSPQTGEDTCPRCGGSGRLGGQACPACAGRGTITVIVGDA